MGGHWKFLWVSFIILYICSSTCAEYTFQKGFFETSLDHFSFTTGKTFKLKYLYNDTHWNKKGKGPIFFYTGNEGDIELFAQNTGFMWDIAAEFGALLLFAEHRYYGESLPFGNQSFSKPEHVGYLTSEQALADFADFLTWFKKEENASKSPVIAFGGSYGGMLTAWMRMKYPHIIQGGIAASAPIWQFEGLAPCDIFSQIVTNDFKRESSECVQLIRKSWDVINAVGSTDGGRLWISKAWRLCRPLQNKLDIKKLKDWLIDVYGNLAMVNYPYPSSFLEPLPGYPIREFCKHLKSPTNTDKFLLKSLFKGLSVYFNYTGTAKCLDIGEQAVSSLGDFGWDFQACTEMVMPMCSDGKNDMFEPSVWNFTSYAQECARKWKVTPRLKMAETIYGARNIKSASNIVFSNGLLDPWSGGGVMESLSDSLIAVIIPEGAHHLDLRAATPKDPVSVIHARKIEKKQIRKWIEQFREENSGT